MNIFADSYSVFFVRNGRSAGKPQLQMIEIIEFIVSVLRYALF